MSFPFYGKIIISHSFLIQQRRFVSLCPGFYFLFIYYIIIYKETRGREGEGMREGVQIVIMQSKEKKKKEKSSFILSSLPSY
jgi:hypothetical protein